MSMTNSQGGVEPVLASLPAAVLIGTLGLVSTLVGVVIAYPQRARTGAARPEHEPYRRLQIDLNEASAAELSLLPGVGPILAERIVRDRQTQGTFGTVEEISRVRGIGAKTLEAIASYVVVGRQPESTQPPMDRSTSDDWPESRSSPVACRGELNQVMLRSRFGAVADRSRDRMPHVVDRTGTNDGRFRTKVGFRTSAGRVSTPSTVFAGR